MYLIAAFITFELMVVLSLAMYIDGRRPSPSIWIRSDILLGIVANIAVSLLLVSSCALVATVYHWWQHGVQVSHGWLIVLSVAITIWVLKRMIPQARLASISALGNAVTETLPQAAQMVMPAPPSATGSVS